MGLPSVLAETNASGTITAYYVYGLGLVSKIEGSNAYFYQYDGVGSTVAITNTSGAVVNKYAYDDFGNVATNSAETIANPFKYVGQFGVMTDASDLLYMRARYYMPSIGRFISKDFIADLNSYAYTDNNPINNIDANGLVAQWIVGGLIGAGVDLAFQIGWNIFDNNPSTSWNNINWWEVGGSAALGAGGGMCWGKGPWIGKIGFHLGHASGPHKYPHIQIMIRVAKHITKHITKHIRIPPYWLRKFFGY